MTTSLRTDLVDKSIKFYWCRTRVKGLKRLRQTQTAEETAEAEGSGPMMLSGMDNNACTPATMGLRTAADVEALKSEASEDESCDFCLLMKLNSNPASN